MDTMKQTICEGAKKLGIDITDQSADALIRYFNILVERNKSVNLTRITEPFDVATKHFLDSLTPITSDLVKGKVIDVGTGAGFPGLVIKCAMPDIELTLLDSLNKRIEFLRDAADLMGIKDKINFVHARAEDAGKSDAHRSMYDTVLSRAVANMRTLSEWCLPLLKTGGYFLALKGPLADSELDDARPAISVLGGEVIDVMKVNIPFTELDHKIIIVKKVRQTPQLFPRMGKKATAVPAEKAVKM